MVLNENVIRDAMYYLSLDSNTPTDKANGVIVGLVSGTMALTGMDYRQTTSLLRKYIPSDVNIDAIPEYWRADLLPAYKPVPNTDIRPALDRSRRIQENKDRIRKAINTAISIDERNSVLNHKW